MPGANPGEPEPGAPARAPHPRWEAVAAACFPVALLLPFLNKAYHIDDPLSLWTAQHILAEPLRFFDYVINWTGVNGEAYLIIKNPPLSMYYIAAIGALFGFSEPVQHAAFLCPAALVGFGTYRIAARFCSRPLLASFAAVLTPAVLVSASNVMTTVAMLALYVVALDLWLSGLQRNKTWMLFAAGIVIAACAMTQYFGASLVPLLFVYTALRLRRAGWWIAALAVPVAVLLAYDLATRQLFGYGMLFEAGEYAQSFRGEEAQGFGTKLLIGLLFTGGCAWTALWYAPLLGRRALAGAAALAVCSAVAGWLSYTVILGHSVGQSSSLSRVSMTIHVAFFLTAAILILALACYDLYVTRSADSLLLLLWILGTFAFAAVVNWTANGRSLLGMCPPVAILVVRALDRRAIWGTPPGRAAWGMLAPMAAVCLVLVYTDFTLANSARAAARYMLKDLPMGAGRKIYFGHWGFQYYMDRGENTEHFNLAGTTVGPGDALILPTNNMRQMDPPAVHSHELAVAFDVFPWASTFDFRTGAGFYASAWGPLPYAFGPVPKETYVVRLYDRTTTMHDPRLDPETGLPIAP